MDEAERHNVGMSVRRAVLGDAHVDRAASSTTSFAAAFQDLYSIAQDVLVADGIAADPSRSEASS